MNHEEIRELIHAYADGELDVVNAREIEQHLSTCEDCRARERRIRALRNTLVKSGPAYRAPARLRKTVRATLRRETKSARDFFSPWLLFATGAACVLLILGVAFFQTTRTSRNTIA